MSLTSAISERFRDYVERGELTGAVVAVYQGATPLARIALGVRELTKLEPICFDDLFWVASMTKPITAAAALMLVDEGAINLNAPVSDYLPEFADPWLLTTHSPEEITLRRPPRLPRVLDLLTHTHGFAIAPLPHTGTPLSQWVAEVARLPLQFAPGSCWQYGNDGMNVLGRIVEVISGGSFAEFVANRIFIPLGMATTTFCPTRTQCEKLAKPYRIAPETHQLVEAPILLLNGVVPEQMPTTFPGGGLFSTAPDMVAFYRTLQNGGRAENGHRLLRTDTVAQMLRIHTADLEAGFSPGMGWGLGVGIVRAPQGWTAPLTPGSWGHDGAYGTSVMIEPEKNLLMLLLIQRAGLDPARDGLKFRHALHSATMSKLFTR